MGISPAGIRPDQDDSGAQVGAHWPAAPAFRRELASPVRANLSIGFYLRPARWVRVADHPERRPVGDRAARGPAAPGR